MALSFKATTAALAFAATAVLATGAHAELPVVDVGAIAQAAKQVEQGMQQVEALQSQVQSQLNMLKSIGANYASVLPGMNSQLSSILTSAQGVGYGSGNIQGLLTSIYPDTATIAGMSPATLTNALQAWHNSTNQSLLTALQTQQQIAQSQPSSQAAVQGALTASQSAVGQTSAIQATNQLLATVSTQLTQLQAILSTQARVVELAQQQSRADGAAAVAAASEFEQRVNGGTLPMPSGVTNTDSL